MKVSTKGRYALRVMLDLAQHKKDGFISLKEIAERQEISMKYLEMIVGILNRAGFVSSLRGKTGGYKLTNAPKDYTIGSILKLMEGSLAPVSCLEGRAHPCSRKQDCQTILMWAELYQIMDEYLESVTLEDLMLGKVKRKF